MRKRALGNTGIQIPELCLGTWGLSGDAYGAVPEAEQDQVILRALALGVTAFETSDAYGNGAMESRLGRLLESNAEAVVITKVGTDRAANPPRKRFEAEYVERAVLASHERLKRPIDVLLLHNPSTQALTQGTLQRALDGLRERGVIKFWGVSAGNAEIGNVSIELGARVVSVAFNAFHQQDLRPLAFAVREREIGVLARSVLAHGLLCGQWPNTKQFAPEDQRAQRWTPDELRRRIQQLSAMRPAVHGSVTSLRAAALRYALSEDLVSSVVIGPRSAIQLDQLLRDAGKEPPYLLPEVKQGIERRLENVGISV